MLLGEPSFAGESSRLNYEHGNCQAVKEGLYSRLNLAPIPGSDPLPPPYFGRPSQKFAECEIKKPQTRHAASSGKPSCLALANSAMHRTACEGRMESGYTCRVAVNHNISVIAIHVGADHSVEIRRVIHCGNPGTGVVSTGTPTFVNSHARAGLRPHTTYVPTPATYSRRATCPGASLHRTNRS